MRPHFPPRSSHPPAAVSPDRPLPGGSRFDWPLLVFWLCYLAMFFGLTWLWLGSWRQARQRSDAPLSARLLCGLPAAHPLEPEKAEQAEPTEVNVAIRGRRGCGRRLPIRRLGRLRRCRKLRKVIDHERRRSDGDGSASRVPSDAPSRPHGGWHRGAVFPGTSLGPFAGV